MPGYNHKGGYSRGKNLIGERFSRLLVVEKGEPYIDAKTNKKSSSWICKCDCGNIVRVRGNSLSMGKTKSCGCLNREKPPNNIKHNMSNSTIYRNYLSMLGRCQNKNASSYKYYGGKGIEVCSEWLGENGFINFYEWSKRNGWEEGLSLERIDVNGNYCPDNCCWIPKCEQALNKSNTYISDGIMVAKLAREKNIVRPNVARARCKRGWNVFDAVSTPMRCQNEKM